MMNVVMSVFAINKKKKKKKELVRFVGALFFITCIGKHLKQWEILIKNAVKSTVKMIVYVAWMIKQ